MITQIEDNLLDLVFANYGYTIYRPQLVAFDEPVVNDDGIGMLWCRVKFNFGLWLIRISEI